MSYVVIHDDPSKNYIYAQCYCNFSSGFLTKEALHNIAETTLINCRDFFNDKVLENEVCYQCGKGQACLRQKNKRCF